MVPTVTYLAAISLALATVNVQAHGGEDHGDESARTAARPMAGIAPPAAEERPQRLADGSLFVPKPVQRRLGIRTMRVRAGDLASGVELNGTIIVDPETGGRVQAPFAGILLAGPKGMPLAGRKVSKGEVLAYLKPVASAIEQGNQKALLAELDAQLAIAEQRVKRYAQLEGAVPQKEIEAARIERDALERRRALVAASIDTAHPLLAPVSGIVSTSRQLVAGQIVDARELLFEIVDPAHLAVEALAYDPEIVATLNSAQALVGKNVLQLDFVGSSRLLREQALPLLFRIVKPEVPLAVGQPLKVIVRSQQRIKGMAVPFAALIKVGAGETAVWVHAEAERFVARKVRLLPLDAANVVVSEGLHEGDRVVIAGASLLSQVR